MKKLQVCSISSGILVLTICISVSHASAEKEKAQQITDSKLKPEVSEFIKGTYLEHAAEYPDPNEPLEVLKAYLYSKNTLHDLKLFSELVRKYPYSRHAHSGYSNALYEQYVRTGDLQYAKHALNEMVTASRIGYSFHRIHYLEGIKRLALETKEPEIAIQWFKELLSKNPNLWEVNLQYAKLLEALDDPKAIRYFRTAMKVRPEGNSDAHVYLAEYYINRGKYDDALQITLPKEERAFYLDFLHGFALEKLGRGSEAIPLYQKYQSMSQSFPVPSKYRIPGSPFQQGIHFQ